MEIENSGRGGRGEFNYDVFLSFVLYISNSPLLILNIYATGWFECRGKALTGSRIYVTAANHIKGRPTPFCPVFDRAKCGQKLSNLQIEIFHRAKIPSQTSTMPQRVLGGTEKRKGVMLTRCFVFW